MMIVKRLLLVLAVVLYIGTLCPVPLLAAAGSAGSAKELNFVFLHGFNGNASALQLLADSIADQLPAYITDYESAHPDINIYTDELLRSYPNTVNIETWAANIAESINVRFADKDNLILIGHSMGGKTALYAVSHNIGNIADRVAMVVTINSPVKKLEDYYYIGGDTALDYWGAQMLLPDEGVLGSLAYYDSTQDGEWVSANKHWLAFTSCESSPISTQFDTRGVDPLPRDMDDTIVPISCQYADGADVVYYGEYAHSDFSKLSEVADYIASQILTYIFGGNIECSVLARAGSFEHEADLLPGKDYWEDIVGGVLGSSGTITHKNTSFFKWEEWEDVVGEYSADNIRSTFETIQKVSFPFWTGVVKVSWVNPNDSHDGRIRIKTRAAPKSSVQVDWSVYLQGLLPSGIERDHYEIEIETGAQVTGIGQAFWQTGDASDLRLRIESQAQSPFHWFRAQWRVYYKETRQREIISSLRVRILTE
jgi:pimeloyl-ACP methyl ester carboxylesterase